MRTSTTKHLSDLLSRYKSLTPPQGVVIDVCSEVIEEVCGASIRNKLSYTPQTQTLHIKGGVYKSEVLLKKEEVLRRCAHKLGAKAPKAIA